MKYTHTILKFGAALVAAAVILLAPGDLRADTVKLKDGKTLEGLITFEADDMLKIRVQKSASISETVTLLRSEIAEVIKSAPDDLEFAKIKSLLPTPSLMTTSRYRSMIEKGPQAFLNAYTDSPHRPEVEKIKKELDEELARVDKGEIKIEGEWINTKSQQNFPELIEARILNLRMRQNAQQGNFIGALRDFEKMEENYYGTPSFVESVRSMLELLPSVGKRLQRMVQDVEFVNSQFLKDLEKMIELDRAKVVEAREREVAALKKKYEADKSAGIKWYSLNQRDKDDLNAYIQLVANEIDRLKALDLAALEEQAKQLVKVDELLAEDKLIEAKELMKATTGIKGRSSRGSSTRKHSDGYGEFGKGGSTRTSSGSRRGSSSSRVKTSYILALQKKILEKEKAVAAAKERTEDKAAGTAAANKIRSADVMAAAAPLSSTETVEGQARKGDGGTGALTELIASNNIPEKKEPATTSKSKPSKTKKSTSRKDSADEDEKPRRNVARGGGGFKFKYVIWGVTGLLVLAVVLMKVLGIGAKEA